MSNNENGTKMNRAISFDKARRKRQFRVTLKRMIILAGVMVLVLSVLLINKIFVEESLTTTISDLAESFGGAGFPVDLPGGAIRIVDNVGNNLTVLNDTNLYIYSPKGKIVKNIQKMTEHGAGIAAGSRLLTFAVGDRDFSVHSISRELYKSTLEYGILCGDLNENGDFALVSQVKQFAAKTIVYNKHFEEIYAWSSPEYVTNVAISPKGDMMAVGCLGTDSGKLESLIYMFRFKEEKEQAEVALRLEESLVLDLIFPEEDRVLVLTDKELLVLNSHGEEKFSYDFADRQIISLERRDRETLLLLKTGDGGRYQMVLLDADLKEKASITQSSEIKDMAISRDLIYTLSSAGIGVYDMSLELKSKLNKRNVSNIHFADSRLYYLTADEIRVLSQSELSAAPSRPDSGKTAAQNVLEFFK